ncbi:glycosyltransferase family 2 protein [Pseudonocardia benzenivorans]
MTPVGRAIAAALASPFGVGGSVYHHGTERQEVDHIPFGAYPTALVRELGGWDENLVANEDFEFDHRVRLAGHKLLFDPAMTISWHSRQTIRDLFLQYRRYGRGKVAVALLHPRSMRPRHLMVPAFVAYLAGALLVALRRPSAGAALVAPYAVAVAAASARTARDLAAGSGSTWRPRSSPCTWAGGSGSGRASATRPSPGCVVGRDERASASE